MSLVASIWLALKAFIKWLPSSSHSGHVCYPSSFPASFGLINHHAWTVTTYLIADAAEKQNSLTGLRTSLCMNKLLGLKGTEESVWTRRNATFAAISPLQITRFRKD